MKFYAHLVGQGEGCDYTIGCNQVLRSLAAKTIEEARTEIAGWFTDEYYNPDSVANIRILSVMDEEYINIYAFSEAKKLKEETIMKEKRRAEYEWLKREFGV